MKNIIPFSSLVLSFFLLLPAIVGSKENALQNTGRNQSGWSSVVRGGAVYQSGTDLDEGGSYSSGRYNVEVGQNYAWGRRDTATLSISYSLDNYDFSDGEQGGAAFHSPWRNIHTFAVSTPMRKGIGDNWTAFLVPSLRSSGESGSEFSKTITGGGFTGISYKFGNRLTIGPGIGVFTQLEESASIFPILIINWKMTEKLSLETGRGLAATLGPGLTLNYKATPKLRIGLGGRYEKLRFRLDRDGEVAGGIGEDSSFPLFASCTYSIDRKASISIIGGLETGGELKIENSKGHSLIEESSDAGMFTGVTFNMRF